MKKVINRKLYDTETAKEIGCCDNDYPRNDFYFYEETLYQKRTGEFFLFGSGNAASKYSRSVGQNSWCGDERIIPMAYESARKWVEEHLDADIYEAVFGEIAEDDTKEAVCLSLSSSIIEQARRKAAAEGRTFSELVESLLSEAVREKEH